MSNRMGISSAMKLEHIERLNDRRALHRAMAFARQSIDDVVNSRIAKNHVLGYYKLHRQVERGCEIVDLERWWNG